MALLGNRSPCITPLGREVGQLEIIWFICVIASRLRVGAKSVLLSSVSLRIASQLAGPRGLSLLRGIMAPAK